MSEKEQLKSVKERLESGELINQPCWSFIRELNSGSEERLESIAIQDGYRQYTYRQMFRYWERYAEAFSALNITGKNHSRVALVGTPLTETVFAFYGLNMTGAGVSLIYHFDLYDDKQIHSMIEREKIRAVEGSLAKSQFLFNMSHDIRTPMNAIIGYTTLARKEEDPAVLHDYLGKIDTSSHHLLTLINDILEMSRIESGKIELAFVPTDLKALFDEIHDLFAEQMRQKQLDFTVHTGQVQHRYAWCDKKNLTRVLLNVVSNDSISPALLAAFLTASASSCKLSNTSRSSA